MGRRENTPDEEERVMKEGEWEGVRTNIEGYERKERKGD